MVDGFVRRRTGGCCYNRNVRYVNAFIAAVFVWVVTVFVMGVLIGQMFDGVKGWWQVVPVIGVWGTSLGVAGIVFRRSLRWDRSRNGGCIEGPSPRPSPLSTKEREM